MSAYNPHEDGPESSPAESRFAAWLTLREQAQAPPFEEFCNAHPAHVEELRRLHDEWLVVDPHVPAMALDPGESPEGVEAAFALFRGHERERVLPATELVEGRLVDGFRLEKRIGGGGMGEVWSAHQLNLGERLVALKFVRPDRLTRSNLKLFAREARAAGRLAHPGIVGLYAYGRLGNLAWIAMELIPGARDLYAFLELMRRLERLPVGYERTCARIVAEIAEAMAAAHACGVIHRDLKPENVLLSPEDRAKVTDFGLARIRDESGLSLNLAVGTLGYMSPEHIDPKGTELDARADVFSLGVVLYELLTLELPYGASLRSADDLRRCSPPDPRALRPKLPRELAAITLRALEPDLGRRYPSMATLAADLRRFLAHEPVSVAPPSVLERAIKVVRRNPGRSAAAAFAALTFLTVTTLLAANLRANRALLGTQEELKVRAQELGASLEREREIGVERDQALQESRHRLGEAHVRNAELAARRGDWGEVLEQVDAAREAGYPDGIELRYRAADARLARYEREVALEEFQALATEPDLGAFAGPTHVRLGALHFLLGLPEEEGVRELERALNLELQPAERTLAEGIVAPHSDRALELLRDAVKHDPTHYLAHSFLLSTLFTSGRFEEAQEQARMFAVLYPDDPTPVLLQAMMRVLGKQGLDPAGFRRDLEGKLGPERVEGFFALSEDLSAALAADHIANWIAGSARGNLLAGAQRFFVGTRRRPPLMAAGGWSDYLITIPSLRRGLAPMLQALGHIQWGRWEQAETVLRGMLEHHGDGLTYHLLAACVMETRPQDTPDAMVAKLEEAEALYALGQTRPSLLKNSSLASDYWRVYAKSLLDTQTSVQRPPRPQDAGRDLLRILDWPEADVDQFEIFAGLARRYAHSPFEALVHEWALRFPEDTRPARLLAEEAVRRGAWPTALEQVEALLAEAPEDAQLLAWRERILSEALAWVEKRRAAQEQPFARPLEAGYPGADDSAD